MKKIEVVSESVETQFEAVVEDNNEEGDRTAADYADSEPNVTGIGLWKNKLNF
jgi:hypothetical protein